MEQPNFASYVPSPYPYMMDLSVSHQPFRSASNGPTSPESRQHSFNESSYFGTIPQELLNIPVSRVARSSLDPWLMGISGTASPESSRLSMSPSQGIATPPSDDSYSPPYPEQLQLPAYQLLEQPQPLRSYSTSHPNWVNSTENWQREYPGSDIWPTQPFVAQPWIPNSYEGYGSSDVATVASSHADFSNEAHLPYTYPTHGQIPEMQALQAIADAANTGSAFTEDANEDESSSDEGSDWSEEASNYSQAEASSSRPKPKTRSPHPHVDKWTVPVNSIQQSNTRGCICSVPNCGAAFVRPEHLRRHVKSKHIKVREYVCPIPGCGTMFSRSDNLQDHYWTHLHRGGRAGKNKKYTMSQLKEIFGSKEKKTIKKLRQKLNTHLEKEKQKKQRVARPAYVKRSML